MVIFHDTSFGMQHGTISTLYNNISSKKLEKVVTPYYGMMPNKSCSLAKDMRNSYLEETTWFSRIKNVSINNGFHQSHGMSDTLGSHKSNGNLSSLSWIGTNSSRRFQIGG
jgi:hypothetical protein